MTHTTCANRHTPLPSWQLSHNALCAKVSACFVYRLCYGCGDMIPVTIVLLQLLTVLL